MSPPSARRSTRGTTAAVLATALVARLLYWRLAIPDYQPVSDDAQYLELATNIANGDGFSLVFPQLTLHATAFRPPLYPFLLAGLFRVVGGPSVAWGQALNLVLGLVVVYLSIRLGRRIGGRAVGTVAGLVVALYPPLIANDLVLLTEPLSLVILLGCLLTLLDHRWVPAGLLAGALVLTRPSAQFLVVVLVVWAVVVGRRSGVALRAGGLVAAAAVLVVTPWVVRNAVVFGEPLLVTSNGFNAAALYSPAAVDTGAFVDPVHDERFESIRLTQFDEAAWQHELQGIAVDEIRAHPAAVPRVMLRNLRAYFELQPSLNEGAERIDGRNLTVRTLALPLVWLNVVLGAWGLWRMRRREAGWLLIAVAAYFCLSSLVFIAAPRVRAPVDLVLCVATATVLVPLARAARRRWASG